MDETPIQFLNTGVVDKISLDDKIIKSILYTIRKEKSTLPSLVKDTLWNSDTIEELTLVVKDIVSPANEGKTFFLIVKEEDPLSPYFSNYILHESGWKFFTNGFWRSK